MLVLLPPSEGKAAPRRGAPLQGNRLSFPALTEARDEVMGALIEVCQDPERAVAVLGVGASLVAEVTRNISLLTAPTQPARDIYTGVLYDALSLPTLTGAAAGRATRSVVIASALFGWLTPADRIPAYRLSGDVSLPGLGGVAAHWRGVAGPPLLEALGRGLLIDLRSTTYVNFWKPPPSVDSVTVKVWQQRGEARSIVSHFNKATKGRLVRELLESGGKPRTAAQLAHLWRDLGWTVDSTVAGVLDVVVTEL